MVFRKVNRAAEELYKKILALDVNKLNIGDYNKKYLLDIKKSLYSQLQRYAYILTWILSENNSAIEKIKFLDYGGGTGVLSLLAKQLGIAEVYYNDIYDISCKDAKTIADSLHLPKRDYIEGDLDDVIQYCKRTNVYFNGIGSNDVIEHIYDIDDFFMNIDKIADETCTMFMCTSANPYNKTIKKRLIKGHKIAETIKRKKVYGWKERDSIYAYRDIRRNIIEEYIKENNIQLSEEQIQILVDRTIGLIEQDIKKSVDIYLQNGKLPKVDQKYPSNTCDPYTGNWAEHLMDFEQLLETLKNASFYRSRSVPTIKKASHSNHISILGIK